jgi:glycosyltransferase involved in cell wall biosynthesis
MMILGTRGIPAQHGGFETFAEELALFLTGRGHKVTVYCQNESLVDLPPDVWRGVHRIFIRAPSSPLGTITFDWKSMLDALKRSGIILTLGYNTAVFTSFYRLVGKPSIMNMDGLEWKREKWSRFQRLWLRMNEFAGAKLANHLVADHPQIGKHLERHVSPEKITVIPYGAESVNGADPECIVRHNLEPHSYALVIARPEPENSILDIVRAYSSRPRNMPLVVLGRFLPDRVPYHKKVLDEAGPEVVFPGGIYDKQTVAALRFFCRVYIHGHQVGGTNPSLVESLAAGTPTIAHDNRFTRWVAGEGARYFERSDDLALILDEILDNDEMLVDMSSASRLRYADAFTQDKVLGHYETLLSKYAPKAESETNAVLEHVILS